MANFGSKTLQLPCWISPTLQGLLNVLIHLSSLSPLLRTRLTVCLLAMLAPKGFPFSLTHAFPLIKFRLGACCSKDLESHGAIIPHAKDQMQHWKKRVYKSDGHKESDRISCYLQHHMAILLLCWLQAQQAQAAFKVTWQLCIRVRAIMAPEEKKWINQNTL